MLLDNQILETYNHANKNKAEAARILGLTRSSFRRRLNKILKVEIKGILPKCDKVDPREIWSTLINAQEKKERHIALARNQRIKIKESLPFVIALFSDLHIGNSKTDYRALAHDTQLVKNCPYCYAITAGDHFENWIGKLGYLSRDQEMSLDTEHILVKAWFDEIMDSLLAVCAGNHDNRSILTAGIDYIRNILGDAVMLYDQDQILFTLETASAEIVFKIRHRDQYRSIMNPFHGAFRDIERGDCRWDVYISGHDHKGTLFGDYIHHDSPKKVCRLGTYKMDDRFGKFLGFAKSYGTGSGALLITPDGHVQSYNNIKIALQCCEALRNQVGTGGPN